MKDSKQTKEIIKGYWNNKENRAQKAKEHTDLVLRLYEEKIEYSIFNSITYGYPDAIPSQVTKNSAPEQIFVNKDTVDALLYFYDKSKNKKTCVLNFASYKHPGGGFLKGSSAQEESLCHESFLYNVLSNERFNNYYKLNNTKKNLGLYTDRAIYSPDIIFSKDLFDMTTDVITCAAPNIASASKQHSVSDKHNHKVLVARMQFIADILEENKVQVFFAGAFGCGVFGQDAKEVADIWKNEIKFGEHLKMIIHPVPFNDENARTFRDIFV